MSHRGHCTSPTKAGVHVGLVVVYKMSLERSLPRASWAYTAQLVWSPVCSQTYTSTGMLLSQHRFAELCLREDKAAANEFMWQAMR